MPTLRNSLTVLYTIPFFLILLSACAESPPEAPIENGLDEKEAFNIIELSGEETSQIGTQLIVANIAVGRADLTGTEESVILLDKNSEVTDDGLVVNDLQNSFIIIAGDLTNNPDADKDISMNILVDGTEYKHACSTPPGDSFIDCGEKYNIDFEKKEIVFDETTVVNTKTKAVLTMTGTVQWE